PIPAIASLATPDLSCAFNSDCWLASRWHRCQRRLRRLLAPPRVSDDPLLLHLRQRIPSLLEMQGMKSVEQRTFSRTGGLAVNMRAFRLRRQENLCCKRPAHQG